MKQTIINNLIEQLVEIEKGSPWLDETFEKKLTAITDDNAFIRPLPGMHSIAEIMSHLVIWRFEIISRLQGNDRNLWESSPENWKSNEELQTRGWNDLINKFNESQIQLISMLKTKEDSFLNTKYKDRNFQYLLEGFLHHDLYHLGQIGLVNKMLKP